MMTRGARYAMRQTVERGGKRGRRLLVLKIGVRLGNVRRGLLLVRWAELSRPGGLEGMVGDGVDMSAYVIR